MKWLITFAAICLIAPLAVAQNAVTLKMYKPKAGDVVKQTTTDLQRMTAEGMFDGKAIKQDISRTVKLEYSDKVIKVENDKAIQYERTFTKASVEAMGQTTKLDAVEGKTVVVAKTDGKFTYQIDGKELAAELKDLVFRDSNKNDDVDTLEQLFPKTPIKDGDTWKVDMDVVIKELKGGMDIDKDKSTGTGKLIKSYKKGNAQYGQLELKMDLAIKGLGKGPDGAVKEGEKLTISFILDICIDGTEEGGIATMTMKGQFVSIAPKTLDMKMGLDIKMEGTKEHVKK